MTRCFRARASISVRRREAEAEAEAVKERHISIDREPDLCFSFACSFSLSIVYLLFFIVNCLHALFHCQLFTCSFSLSIVYLLFFIVNCLPALFHSQLFTTLPFVKSPHKNLRKPDKTQKHTKHKNRQNTKTASLRLARVRDPSSQCCP
jgi:hypothetical protein